MSWLRERWFGAILIAIGIAVIAIAAAIFAIGAHRGGSAELAQIGDFVGGVSTPILTALTFIGILIGISLQRNELIATRKELEETRKETARSAQALDRQADAIALQNFENSLFQSLGFLNDIVKEISVTSVHDLDESVEGRDAFSTMRWRVARLPEMHNIIDLQDILASEAILQNFERYSGHLSIYFRTLYNVYRFLDESRFKEKKFYSRIIRAQIENEALALLFYNSLLPQGEKFQEYIYKYDILDNLPVKLLLHPAHEIILDQLKAGELLN